MPAQNRVGSDNRGDFGQHPTPTPLPPLREPTPLRIRQPQAPAAELTPKCAVFLDQIGDDVLLLAIQPTGQHDETNPDGRAIHDRVSLHHRVRVEPHGRSADSWDNTRPLVVIGDDHRPFARAAQLLKDNGGPSADVRRSAAVTTTRAGRCRMSVETARRRIRARSVRGEDL
jgi:hypothetical protein